MSILGHVEHAVFALQYDEKILCQTFLAVYYCKILWQDCLAVTQGKLLC